jgi:glucokinase
MSEPLVVGVDLGGSHVAAGVVNRAGTILGRSDQFIDRDKAAEMLLSEDIAKAIRDAIKWANLEPKDIVGVGMGLPGNIDRATGICRFSPNFHWHNVPVSGPLSRALGLPVYLLNDVRSHTLGELHFGAGRGVRSFAMLALGTGIGGGLVLNGKLHEGAHSGGGEVGHITVEPGGYQCQCGNHGCIEALASAPNIARLAREEIAAGRAQGIKALAGSAEAVTAQTLSEAALKGDAEALALWERIGHWLGIAVASIITTVDPERVLIGGGVARAGELLLRPVREEVVRRCRMIDVSQIPIQQAALGENAGMLGAAALALESLGHLPSSLNTPEVPA